VKSDITKLDIETSKDAKRILDAIGIKVGQQFTERQLINKLCDNIGIKIKPLAYPPDEIIDDMNMILNSLLISTLYKREL